MCADPEELEGVVDAGQHEQRHRHTHLLHPVAQRLSRRLRDDDVDRALHQQRRRAIGVFQSVQTSITTRVIADPQRPGAPDQQRAAPLA